MRDPNRIDTVLNEIRAYWVNNPELRLAQIIGNAATRAGYVSDAYYMEDKVLLDNLNLDAVGRLRLSGEQNARRDDLKDLVHNLGQTLTAGLAGVDVETVSAWTEGYAEIPDIEAKRLRTGSSTRLTITLSDGADVARAWFIGANPWLGDDTAVTAIREDRHDQVIAAARAHVDDTFSG